MNVNELEDLSHKTLSMQIDIILSHIYDTF